MAGINDIDSSIQNLIKMTNAKVAITKLWETHLRRAPLRIKQYQLIYQDMI